jgi:HEAT repeat protein
VIELARRRVRRASLHRNLEAVAFGTREKLSIDVRQKDDDFALVLEQITKPLACDNVGLQRLMAEFRNSGIADAAIERLSAKSPSARRQSARLLGAVRMTQAVTLLAPLLESKDRAVVDAAARALGRIGGAQSAQMLLMAIQRIGLRRTLIGELARAAPDLFLEVVLSEAQRPGLKPAAALAAGLRRRQTAVGPLVALLIHGTPRERAISCRALGWIGSSAAVPAVIAAVEDPEWKVRVAAAKALRALHSGTAILDLERLRADRNRRVRQASAAALRRLLRDVKVVELTWL